MDRDRRGGYRQPARPTAVSNPQSGQRTDGGPGSSRQPIRVASGGRYGERQASVAQQQAAPLPDRSGGGVGAAGAAPAPPVGGGTSTPNQPVDAFGPTGLPMESNTAGAQANPILDNPDVVMRLLYARFPHPNIGNLIRTGRDYR